jgi:hypothetical protein
MPQFWQRGLDIRWVSENFLFQLICPFSPFQKNPTSIVASSQLHFFFVAFPAMPHTFSNHRTRHGRLDRLNKTGASGARIFKDQSSLDF